MSVRSQKKVQKQLLGLYPVPFEKIPPQWLLLYLFLVYEKYQLMH